MRTSSASLSIGCFCDGIIVGHCAVNFNKGIKVRHRASVAIAIRREYWNLGIGSCMFTEMINAARANNIEIMELDFIEGNDRARHLYEKFGFAVVAERPNMFKLHDGTTRKELYMQKIL